MTDSDLAPLNDPTVNIDDLFDLVSNRRRQTILLYLQQMDGTVVDLAELVEWVRTQEANHSNKQHDPITVALHHVHLPKLAEFGLIDYDAQRGTIRYDRHPVREQKVALAVEMIEGLS